MKEIDALAVPVATGVFQAMMQPTIDSTICQNIGGDHQQITSKNSDYLDITFKHLLLPIWISAYRYQERVYRFLVNARSGEVQGERPYSVWKILSLILACILVVVLVGLFAHNR